MSKIKTGEMRRRKFGDVCNPNGDLLGNDGDLLNSGVVRVTPEQAIAAEAYRWERVGEEDGMVLVSRSSNKGDLYVPRKADETPMHDVEAAEKRAKVSVAWNGSSREFHVTVGLYAAVFDRREAAYNFARAVNALPATPTEVEALRTALGCMIYETTSLSPCKPNGDHDCTIRATTLAKARLAYHGTAKVAASPKPDTKCRYCGGAGKFQVVSPVSDHAWATCFCRRFAPSPLTQLEQAA